MISVFVGSGRAILTPSISLSDVSRSKDLVVEVAKSVLRFDVRPLKGLDGVYIIILIRKIYKLINSI